MKKFPGVTLKINTLGVARKQLEDRQGALVDFKKAADIYQRQGKINYYQDALYQIHKLQQ